MPILVGTDGVQKMSKSLDNYVGVEDPPNEMYGKIMSLPDDLIIPYIDYLTDTSNEELADITRDLAAQAVNPMLIKKRLAHEITANFHDATAADAAQGTFEQVVQQRDTPDDLPEFSWQPERRWSVVLVDTQLVGSTTEAKRLIKQGAVDMILQSGESETVRIDSPAPQPQPQYTIKVGKRRFARLANSSPQA